MAARVRAFSSIARFRVDWRVSPRAEAFDDSSRQTCSSAAMRRPQPHGDFANIAAFLFIITTRPARRALLHFAFTAMVVDDGCIDFIVS